MKCCEVDKVSRDIISEYGYGDLFIHNLGHGVGLVLGEQDNPGERILSYWKGMDWEKYNNNCKKYIEDVLNDFNTFEQKIILLWQYAIS